MNLAQARSQLTKAYAAAMEALDQAEAASSVREVTEPIPLLLPLAKTAELLNVSRTTVFAMADSGTLRTVDLPGVSGRFVRRDDLEAFVAALRPAKKARKLRVAT